MRRELVHCWRAVVASGKLTVSHAACAASGLGTTYSLSSVTMSRLQMYVYRTDAHTVLTVR